MNPTNRSTASDGSNGYERVAGEFISYRSHSSVGVASVREWARGLPPGATVLDLGCGHGVPISQTLTDEGLVVYGVDASARMIAAFRARFPHAHVECNTVEESRFFGRTFDGVVAWGLMFLLRPEAQSVLIRKVSGALNRGGQFLFTAPRQACEWSDVMTGLTSVSLGLDAYRRLFAAEGLALIGERQDEGENFYYLTVKLECRQSAAAPQEE